MTYITIFLKDIEVLQHSFLADIMNLLQGRKNISYLLAMCTGDEWYLRVMSKFAELVEIQSEEFQILLSFSFCTNISQSCPPGSPRGQLNKKKDRYQVSTRIHQVVKA